MTNNENKFIDKEYYSYRKFSQTLVEFMVDYLILHHNRWYFGTTNIWLYVWKSSRNQYSSGLCDNGPIDSFYDPISLLKVRRCRFMDEATNLPLVLEFCSTIRTKSDKSYSSLKLNLCLKTLEDIYNFGLLSNASNSNRSWTLIQDSDGKSVIFHSFFHWSNNDSMESLYHFINNRLRCTPWRLDVVSSETLFIAWKVLASFLNLTKNDFFYTMWGSILLVHIFF